MTSYMTMIKGAGGAADFVLGLTSHRFWCCHNNDDYSASIDSCCSINIACSNRREKGEKCKTVTTCFKYSWTPLVNCIWYVCCQWMLKIDYTKFNCILQ